MYPGSYWCQWPRTASRSGLAMADAQGATPAMTGRTRRCREWSGLCWSSAVLFRGRQALRESLPPRACPGSWPRGIAPGCPGVGCDGEQGEDAGTGRSAFPAVVSRSGNREPTNPRGARSRIGEPRSLYQREQSRARIIESAYRKPDGDSDSEPVDPSFLLSVVPGRSGCRSRRRADGGEELDGLGTGQSSK